MDEVDVLKQPIKSPLVKPRKAGDVEELRRIMWRAVRAAEQMMYLEAVTPEMVFKSVYALAQAGGAYMKVLEVHETFRSRLRRSEVS